MPSSPPGPCRAMNTTSGRSAGPAWVMPPRVVISAPPAVSCLTPAFPQERLAAEKHRQTECPKHITRYFDLSSDCRICLPVESDTFRSALAPPIRTATRIGLLHRDSSYALRLAQPQKPPRLCGFHLRLQASEANSPGCVSRCSRSGSAFGSAT